MIPMSAWTIQREKVQPSQQTARRTAQAVLILLLPAPMPLCARQIASLFCAFAVAVLSLVAPTASRADAESLSGQLLVAEPGMPDPRFAETVILMISHDAGGALGLIVNRRIGEIEISDLLAELGWPSEGASGLIGLHFGGPVQPDRGFILHSADHVPDGSNPVGDDFAVAGRPDILTGIAEGSGPKDSLFALGYAGWGPGQLESEMQRQDWFTAPADPELVFSDEQAETWQRVMDRRGVDL